MEKKDTLSSCSNSEIQQMHLIQDKSKESCMVSFQRLHSHLKCLSNNDLKGSRTEEGLNIALAIHSFWSRSRDFHGTTMFLYRWINYKINLTLDAEFQDIGIHSLYKSNSTEVSDVHTSHGFYLEMRYVDMIRNKFLQYTRLDILEFRDTLIQHMESVKKSIGERAQHKMAYESRVNERQIQTTEARTVTQVMHWILVQLSLKAIDKNPKDAGYKQPDQGKMPCLMMQIIRPIYAKEPNG
ncbi:hypothetical protein Tco_0149221 [Tanacetum coccineum]